MNYDPYLSIIIVCHRSGDVIQECLGAIANSDFDRAIEIILVANPIQAGAALPNQFGDLKIQIVSSEKNLGYAGGCNLGAAHARGEYLLFLNPDVIIQPQSLSSLHAVLKENPKFGLTTGRMVLPDGRFHPSCRRFPTPANLLFSRKSLIRWLSSKAASSYTCGDFTSPTEVDATAASMVMISKELFEEIGRFDERFFLYVEDTDLCRRLSEAGYKTIFVPSAIGIHQRAHATRHYRFKRIWWHHHSIWLYFVKHHRTVTSLAIIFPALVINCLLSMGLELVRFKA